MKAHFCGSCVSHEAVIYIFVTPTWKKIDGQCPHYSFTASFPVPGCSCSYFTFIYVYIVKSISLWTDDLIIILWVKTICKYYTQLLQTIVITKDIIFLSSHLKNATSSTTNSGLSSIEQWNKFRTTRCHIHHWLWSMKTSTDWVGSEWLYNIAVAFLVH